MYLHYFSILGCAGSWLLSGLFFRSGKRGSALVVVLGLLIAMASLVAEHRLRASVVEAPGL